MHANLPYAFLGNASVQHDSKMNYPNGVRRPRVLVLARAFPSSAFPGQGLWVERLVRAALPIAAPLVISTIPQVVPFVPVPEWQRLGRVPRTAARGEIPVFYPRVPAGLVHFTHPFDARLALHRVRKMVLRLHAEEPIALIHAHFIYPDGVIAARIGRELGIPVVTTEHANWRPWLDEEPQVRKQVLDALSAIRVITAVSEVTRRTVMEVAGASARVALLPNALDDSVFAAPINEPRVPGRVLFVGMVRWVKGLDVLIRALPVLLERRPDAHLRVIGSTLSRTHRQDEGSVRKLAESLGLMHRVEFVGHLEPREVSAEMRRAAVLAVPSRRESFSSVTIEGLASGLPVVATRCGGPDELLDDSIGRLVPTEDPEAMAAALSEVLTAAGQFDPLRLRARVLPRYGLAATTDRLARLYHAVLADRRPLA